MMQTRTLAAASVALTLGLGACSGGGSQTPVARTPITSAPATPGSALPASRSVAYGSAALARATLAGPAHFGTLSIDLGLEMQDAAGLSAYAAAASTPGSSLYRQFLTPQQIADRFGATQASQNATVAYFAGLGLHARTWSQRMMITVRGTQSQLESAFHTKFGLYRHGTTMLLGPMSPPSLPASVAVASSPNLVRGLPWMRSTRVKAVSNALTGGLSPQQIAAAFDYTGAYEAGYTGKGVNVGVLGSGPISVASSGHVGDVEYFKSVFDVKGASAVTVIDATDKDLPGNAASGFTTPPPVTASSPTCNDDSPAGESEPGYPPSESPTAGCNPEDGETQIDTEQIASLAPDAPVQYYLAYNPNDACIDGNGNGVDGSPCPAGSGFAQQGFGEFDAELQTVLDHDASDILNISGAVAESTAQDPDTPGSPADLTSTGGGIEGMDFAALAAEGVAVFASSGDAGSLACPNPQAGGPEVGCPAFPATDPNVVAVGGVSAAIDSTGALTSPLEVWTGSGGAYSDVFSLPAYQQGLPGIVGSTRNFPDASLVADPYTGVSVVYDADPSLGGPQYFSAGGTSVSSPELAAMWALVLSACKQTPSCATGPSAAPYRLGNPSPLLYGIYAGHGKLPYGKVFDDVTYGNNSSLPDCYYSTTMPCPSPLPSFDPGSSAETGYDTATGLGVPFARHLIEAVVGV